MAKSKDEVKKFIEALEEAGYEPKSYSGRGMYGKSCVSLSGEDQYGENVSAWNVAKALWFNAPDRTMEDDLDVPEPRQDQLGLGIVLYWPRYEWPKVGV